MSRPDPFVIFDCDGVLVDSETIAVRIVTETLQGLGLAITEATVLDRFLGRSVATMTETLARDSGFRVEAEGIDALRTRTEAAFRQDLRPMAHVTTCLDALRAAGIGFCVASSSLPARIELSLTVTGLWPRFEGRAFSASMVRSGKPAPDLFLHAAAQSGRDAEACVVIEDSPAGIIAARRAGMLVLGFTGGGHARAAAHRAAMRAERPTALIDDLRDIPVMLAERKGARVTRPDRFARENGG